VGSNSAFSLVEFRVGRPLSHGVERFRKYGPNLMRPNSEGNYTNLNNYIGDNDV